VKVSVIIPYNIDRGYLGEAISSAKHQAGFILSIDYEIILSQGNGSLGHNVNTGVSRSTGKFIKILAEDDLLFPGCLSLLYEYAIVHNCDLVCANAIYFDNKGWENGIRSYIPRTIKELAERNTIHGGTTLYRASVMPIWNEDLWTAEEYELSLRMATNGCKFGYTPHRVCKYRLHNNMKSGFYWEVDKKKIEDREEYIRTMRSKYYINKDINR
jgi:glycosyltransferase involved in cell wall biosynthesis